MERTRLIRLEIRKKEKLEILFDGAFGYPPSFLDEAFGGLVKKMKDKKVLNSIVIVSNDDLTVKFVNMLKMRGKNYRGCEKMKKDSVKYIVLIVFSLATLVLLILNAVFDFNVFWTVNISDGIEIFVLIFVSYFLVDRQNEKDRKKEKINALINKVQLRLLDADLVKVDTEENRKITRIKVTSISNLLEIIKDNMDNKNNIDNIVTKMDNLSVLIMDHIEDEDYIRKTNSHIIRTVIDIDTKLEKIKFDIN